MKHYGRLDSFPPYVGGDDDEIDEWQATCACGWRDRKFNAKYGGVTSAHISLVKHLNGALIESRQKERVVSESPEQLRGLLVELKPWLRAMPADLKRAYEIAIYDKPLEPARTIVEDDQEWRRRVAEALDGEIRIRSQS